MEASDQSISNPASDGDTLLGTLPLHPQTAYQSRSEPFVSNSDSRADHDEVCQTDSPLASDVVPKGLSEPQGHRPRLVTVKDLAKLYGLNMGAVYAFIKTEPDFPYVNVGVKKKFMIDVARFETWLAERTKKQKHEHFAIPSAVDLATAFKNKTPGGNK